MDTARQDLVENHLTSVLDRIKKDGVCNQSTEMSLILIAQSMVDISYGIAEICDILRTMEREKNDTSNV